MQCVERPSRKTTRRFMSHAGVALVLATGGRALVEAAYSSGTPAIGVGPGNAPAWICADADVDRAASAIVASKTFDNGLVCGAEHSLVVDSRVALPFAAALMRHGVAILTPDEERRFMSRAVDGKAGPWTGSWVVQTIAAALDIVSRNSAFSVVDEVPPSDASIPAKVAPSCRCSPWPERIEALPCQTPLKIVGAGIPRHPHHERRTRGAFRRAMPAGRRN